MFKFIGNDVSITLFDLNEVVGLFVIIVCQRMDWLMSVGEVHGRTMSDIHS